MISDVKNVGHDVLRIVVSGVRVSYEPGQFVMVQSPGLEQLLGGPIHLTITSPMQKEGEAFTLHMLMDDETRSFEANWKKVFWDAQITVPAGYCDPVFQDTVLLVVAETVPRDFSAAIPLVPIIKTYLVGKDHNLARTFHAYLIVEHPEMYRWFIACFEEGYLRRKVPRNVHITIHLNGVKKEDVWKGSALEESFSWSQTPWPNLKETPIPTPERNVWLAFLGSPFDWQRALYTLRSLKATRPTQHYRLCLDIFGYRAPPQFRVRLPDPLPEAPRYWWPTDWLFRGTDPCHLGLFRIAFGASAFLSQLWLVLSGDFHASLIDTEVLFPHDYFASMPTLRTPILLYTLAALVGCSALAVCVGYQYRLSCLVFFVTYTWQWLHDATLYHDHHYLTSLLAFGLLVSNAHHFGSIRSASARVQPVPYWNVVLLKTLILSMYFWSGLNKLDYDWVRGYPIYSWIGPTVGDPLRMAIALLASWLAAAFELALPLLVTFNTTRPAALVMCHVYQALSALLLFPTPCPLLLHTPTPLFLETHTLRHTMLVSLTRWGARMNSRGLLFRILRHIHRRMPYYADEHMAARFILQSALQKAQEDAPEERKVEERTVEKAKEDEPVPVASPRSRRGPRRRRGAGGEKRGPSDSTGDASEDPTVHAPTSPVVVNNSSTPTTKVTKPLPRFPASEQPGLLRRSLIVAFLLCVLLYHLLMPLRPYVYEHLAHLRHADLPGTMGTSWTENGHRFSWRGVLMDKECGGIVTVKTGPPYKEIHLQNPCRRGVHPFLLSRRQCYGVLQRPSLIRQHAALLRDHYSALWGRPEVVVYADLRCTLNGSPIQQYTFRRMNLATLPSPSLANITQPEPFIGPQQYYGGGKAYQ